MSYMFYFVFQRPLSWVFCFFNLNHQFSNWRRQYLNLCLCCFFCLTSALNLWERNVCWPGNCGYSRLFSNDALCKSIVVFHFIDKSVCHICLKSLVFTTCTVNILWRVSISFDVLQNVTEFTIDRRFFLPYLFHAHDTFLMPTDILHIFKWHASVKKGSVAFVSTEILMPLSLNIDPHKTGSSR